MAGVIPGVVEQHAQEAAFLWVLRDIAVLAPHYALGDLADLDRRVEAHLDGLRIAGDDGVRACQRQLGEKEPGEVFAAAVLAFDSADRAQITAVIEVAASLPELSRGLVSALGWLPYPRARGAIQGLTAGQSPALRRVAIAGCVAHRQDPGLGLDRALFDPDPRLRARALRAVGELGRKDRVPELLEHFKAAEPECRFAAAWSAALLGERKAASVLRTIAEAGGPLADRAAAMAIRRMSPQEARDWLDDLVARPEHRRLAVIGAGVLGDPARIPWLLSFMSAPDLARVASQSFSMITGIDLSFERLDGASPKAIRPRPSDDAEDADVAMDPDDNIPWPEPGVIQAWWARHQGEFLRGRRYLLGKPILAPFLADALARGQQRQRAAAALELSILRPGQPLFEVRAPGFRQAAS